MQVNSIRAINVDMVAMHRSSPARGTSPLVVLAAVASLGGVAAADTFGGFSGVDRPYLVNQDRICTPLVVDLGLATGAPACQKVAADVVAKLSIKPPAVQRGARAAFTATAAGKSLTVARGTGDVVVVWTSIDPILKVVEVYASQYEDRVAVAYTLRRLGKEVTDVVAFDVGKAGKVPVGPGTPTGPVAPAASDDPAVTKAVTAARAASKGKAVAAWRAVLAIAPQHGEALYRIAAAQLAGKQRAEALATLAQLAASARPDAIEWLIEARFEPAFAALRSDPAFRTHVGLDRKGTGAYERLMGFGGQWEQTGTSCDRPEVRFTVTRDRVVRIRVVSRCEGRTFSLPFKGTWRLDGAGTQVILTFPTRGKAVDAKDEAACVFETAGDEDALRCALDRDLEFVVLPTRR